MQPRRGLTPPVLGFALFLLVFGGVRIAPPDLAFYYAYAHSLLYDLDFCFVNQYQHFPFAVHELYQTRLGVPANDWPMGAGLAWLPFLLLARLGSGLAALWIPGVDASGYSWFAQWTVTFGSTLLYGAGTLGFSYRFCRLEGLDARAAKWAVGLVAAGSSLTYHLYVNSADSHLPSAFFAAWFLVFWRSRRGSFAPGVALVLGVIAAAGALARPHNGLIAIVPPLYWLAERKTLRPSAGDAKLAAAFAAGAFAGYLPQMLVWKALYGSWLALPRSGDVLWTKPHLYETLFSDYHGMISWSPLFGLGLLGLLISRRRWILAAPVLLQIYIYSCNLAWWAGGSFGNRRMLGCAPLFILGLAALFEAVPKRRIKAIAVICAAWTFLLLLAEMGGEIRLGQYQPWSEIFAAVRDGALAGAWAHFANPQWPARYAERLAGAALVLAVFALLYWISPRLRHARLARPLPVAIGALLLVNLLCAAAAWRTQPGCDAEGYIPYDRFTWVVYYEKGYYLVRNGREGEALDSFIAAAKIEPRHPQPWMYSAYILSRMGCELPAYHFACQAMVTGQRRPDFLRFLEQAVTLRLEDGTHPPHVLHNQRGVARAMLEAYFEAAEDFNRALELRPGYAPAEANRKALQARMAGQDSTFQWE